MQDTKLFETILGITTPWHVARVTLKPEDERRCMLGRAVHFACRAAGCRSSRDPLAVGRSPPRGRSGQESGSRTAP